jgi:hypothetical protein
MLKLVYEEGLTQRELCRMWGWHESKVSRELDQAMGAIREATLRSVARRDPWLKVEWDDFLGMCEASQSPLPL